MQIFFVNTKLSRIDNAATVTASREICWLTSDSMIGASGQMTRLLIMTTTYRRLYREQLAAFDANQKEILRIAFKWSLLESGAGLQWIEWLRDECSGVALIETDAARIQLIQELRQYPFLRAEEWEGRL